MKTIWKFPLERVQEQKISMPKGYEILCVKMQNGVPTIWAVVDPLLGELYEAVRIQMVGTGHSFERENKNYLGTVIDGMFVWHFFEVGD